jgi:PAS domain S-box-containing protein
MSMNPARVSDKHATNGNAASKAWTAEDDGDLRDFFDNAAIALHWVGRDGTILRANQAELDLLGYSEHEYVGHNITEFHADAHVIADLLGRLSNDEVVHDFEARLLRKDGSAVDVLVDSSTLRRNGEFVHTRCFTRDNSHWKQLEDRLRESEARYQDLYDNAPDMFTSVDAATGTYVAVNGTFARATGYTRDELIGRSVHELYHPDSAQAVRDAFDEFVRDGRVRDAEFLLMRKDGMTIPVALNLSAIRDAEGNVLQSRSVLRDMRERNRALKEKQQAINLLDTLLAAAPIGFVVLDTDLRFVRVNEAAAEISGLPAEEHIDKRFEDLIPAAESQLPHCEQVLRDGDVIRNIEVHGATAADPADDRCWLVSYYPIPEGDRVSGVGVVFQEITDRKHAEEALRRQANLLDLAHDAILVRELHSGRIIYWNDAAEKAYGWRREDAIGRITHELLQTEHALGYAYVEQAVGRDGSWDGELSHMTAGGDRINVESRQVVVTEGDTPLVLETNRDVTDRIRAEEILRFSEERYRILVDAIPAMVTLTTPDGRVEYVSQSLLDYTGLTQDEARAGEWTKILHPDDLTEHADEWVASLARGDVLSGEVRIRRHDGAYRWHFGHIAPVRADDGSIRLFVGAHIDIDDRKRTEEELQRTADDLERANAAKDEFLGLVSHELKTPITTIYGNAQILRMRGQQLDEESRQSALADVVKESERLHRIIDNLLVLARLEQGHEIDSEPLLVRRIASHIIDEHRQHHAHRDVRLAVTETPMPVMGQPLYIEQVIRNLLSNAEKYSPASEPIQLTITTDGTRLLFSVLDRGRGFSEDEAQKIFTPFYRAPSAVSRAAGVGIGLAVCKRLIDAQGGEMWARPREGGGADIGFALPLAEGAFGE